MGLDFGQELGVDLAVEVVSELFEEIGAGHGFGPRKVFLLEVAAELDSRNFRRARNKLDLTAGTLKPSASAVSSVEKVLHVAEGEDSAEAGRAVPEWSCGGYRRVRSLTIKLLRVRVSTPRSRAGMEPSSVWTSSSIETVLLVLRLRRRIRLSFTANPNQPGGEASKLPWN